MWISALKTCKSYSCLFLTVQPLVFLVNTIPKPDFLPAAVLCGQRKAMRLKRLGLELGSHPGVRDGQNPKKLPGTADYLRQEVRFWRNFFSEFREFD